jgi:hypothetical protein
MTQGVTLFLPQDAASSHVDDVRRTLAEVEGVTEVRPLEVRAIDPVAVMTWISFTADALSIASVAATAIGGIVDRMRKARVHGAVIQLPNGAKITLDSASPDEILRIVTEWKAEEALWMGKTPADA